MLSIYWALLALSSKVEPIIDVIHDPFESVCETDDEELIELMIVGFGYCAEYCRRDVNDSFMSYSQKEVIERIEHMIEYQGSEATEAAEEF